MKTRASLAALLASAILLSPVSLRAGDDGETAADSPEFQALFGRARVESGKGNLKEAVRLYKAAYELRPNPVLLFNIARLLHKMTRFQEAIIYYQLFLDSPLEDEGQKRKAREAIEMLRSTSGQKKESPARNPVATPLPTDPPVTRPQVESPGTTTVSLADPPTAGAKDPGRAQTPVSVSNSTQDSLATPVYRKWWFWTLIGGAVVAGGVGLGVGLAYAKSNGQLGGSYPNVPENAYQYSPVFLIRVP